MFMFRQPIILPELKVKLPTMVAMFMYVLAQMPGAALIYLSGNPELSIL